MQIFSQIEYGLFLFGCFSIAVATIVFFWGFAEYIFYKGDDAARAHSKILMLNATISLLLILIVWAIFTWIAGYFPVQIQ